nr:immunoglobulin heavy chain junction region [Mus musculus]
ISVQDDHMVTTGTGTSM